MCGYKDLLWSGRTHQNGEQTRAVYTLHVVNNILKTRNKIISNNAKIQKKEDNEDDIRDQGLCRPKALIVVPFKESARRICRNDDKINQTIFTTHFPMISATVLN